MEIGKFDGELKNYLRAIEDFWKLNDWNTVKLFYKFYSDKFEN